MKIAVLVEFFPPSLGSDRRIYEIMKRLEGKHEIHFLVLPSFRMLAGKISQSQDRFRWKRQETVIKHHNMTAHYISAPPLLLSLWRKSFTLAYLLTLATVFFRVLRSAERIKPQIVVLNYPSVYTGLLGYLVGKVILRKPVVLDFNDLIAQYTIRLLGMNSRGYAAKICVWIQNYIVKKSDKVVAVTNYVRAYVLNLAIPADRIAVIPNGVDTRIFDPYRPAIDKNKLPLEIGNRKVCLYCGRLDTWAGTNIISNVCSVFDKMSKDVVFVIAGSGAKWFSHKNAIVTGEIPYDTVPNLVAVADIILVPFPDNEVSRAASPLKLFEGMAMAKAIVASNLDGVRDVVSDQENGVLVDPEDVTEWIEAISRLLKNPLMAEIIGKKARQTVETKYDWVSLAEEYEKNFYI